MKKLFLLLLALGYNTLISQTDSTQKGAYLSFFKYKENTLSYTDSFKITSKATRFEYDKYKIRSLSKTIKKKEIDKWIWGIYDGHDLYINYYWVSNKRKGYSKAQKIGSYLYIKAPPIMSVAQEEYIKKASGNWGLAGGLASLSVVNSLNHDNYNFLIDPHSGVPTLLCKAYLLKLLEKHTDLLIQFTKEQCQDCVETHLKYIEFLEAPQ